MKKTLLLLALTPLLTACISTTKNTSDTVIDDQSNHEKVSESYHEAQTKFTINEFDDMLFGGHSNLLGEEKARLQQEGYEHWHDENNIIETRSPMYSMQYDVYCSESNTGCTMGSLKAFKNTAPSELQLSECDENGWCVVNEPKLDESIKNSVKDLAHFYSSGSDIYSVLGIDSDYTYNVYKNSEKLFSHKMQLGVEGIVEEATMINDSPVFTFYDSSEVKENNQVVYYRNMWYQGEIFNEKYDVDDSSHLFVYKDKLGFIAQKDGKTYVMFDGQKIGGEFDEIRTHACCAVAAYPIRVDSNGILFFMARRGNNLYFAEVNLEAIIQN